jgi:single-strand DNA-binding protein
MAMAYVQVIQRNAHLAAAMQLEFVKGRDGQVAKAVLTAISNARRGSGDEREEEATAIRWTLWGKLAEHVAEYLGKGSHVNIVGRVRNNHYEKDGEDIWSLDFIADEVDFLDSKAEGEARRVRSPSGRRPGGTAWRASSRRQRDTEAHA